MNGFIIAWLAYQALSHGVTMAKHGTTRIVNYWAVIPGCTISYSLLYLGGAFN